MQDEAYALDIKETDLLITFQRSGGAGGQNVGGGVSETAGVINPGPVLLASAPEALGVMAPEVDAARRSTRLKRVREGRVAPGEGRSAPWGGAALLWPPD